MKKNLGGGKTFKGQAGKEDRRTRKNREMVTKFVEDVLANDLDGEVFLARVVKNFGGARMSLLTTTGETKTAVMRNLLRCSRGAARNAANVVAVGPGSFVILHEEGTVSQVIGVLSRSQLNAVKDNFPAPHGFFDEGAVDEGDCGFDWADGTEETEEVDIEAI